MELTNVKLVIIPALLIFVIPFFIVTPLVQQKKLLFLLNQTIYALRVTTSNSSTADGY